MAARETIDVQTKPCIVCGKPGTVRVNIDGYYRWVHGEFIQNALPELSKGEREMLINGTHDECFESMFPPEER